MQKTLKSSNSKTSKKVLFITPQPFMADRGSPLRVKSEVESLSELGYEIDILCFPYGEEYHLKNSNIFRSLKVPGISEPVVGPSWQKIILDIPLALKGLSLGIKNSYDVIHGVEEAAFIAAFISSIKKVPFVADMHSLLPDQLQYSGFFKSKIITRSAYSSYNLCLRKASGIVAVCKDAKDYAESVAPNVPCAQIEDLPIESSWNSDKETCLELINKYNLKDKKIITYTGNFSSYQGIPLLLESFKDALLSNKLSPNTYLLMVGEKNKDIISNTINLATNLGVNDKIIFTGELPSGLMGSVMGISDAVISPRTKGSNTPLKLYCYMASEKPIIATNIYSHTQVLDDSSAYLASPETKDLANAIIMALESTETAKIRNLEKAKNAKIILEKRFNKNTFRNSMAWLYERVTNAPIPLDSINISITKNKNDDKSLLINSI